MVTLLVGALPMRLGNRLTGPAILLLTPIALTVGFRYAALQSNEVNRATVWLRYFRLNRFIMAATVAGWWVGFDLGVRSQSIQPSYAGTGVFWLPPLVALLTYLVLSYSTDSAVLGHRWTFTDTVKQAWWRLVSFVVPLLIVAVGVEAILQGVVAGIIWFILAGILATIGRMLFQRADGIRMHETKSGELRNRAFAMARKMGVALRRVYIVPAGRGHLTNAYGGSEAIGLTDNLGKYLTKREVDSVIAHELAHVRQKHGRKQLLLSIATFALLSLLLFRLSHLSLRSKLTLDIGVIFVPLLIRYFASRRFEYAADREAADYIGDPETAIRALANVYRVSATPPHLNRFTELFTTHPALTRRAQAIAERARLDERRASEILLEVNNRKPKSRLPG